MMSLPEGEFTHNFGLDPDIDFQFESVVHKLNDFILFLFHDSSPLWGDISYNRKTAENI